VADAAGRRREEAPGVPAADATIEATDEVAGPLFAGTLTTLLVFGPIIFVKGLAAALFRDLSLAVVMSVGGSLILALTLMPVMIVGRRRSAAKAAAQAEREAARATREPRAWERRLDAFGARTADAYERGMEWSLLHPGAILV